MIPEKTRAIRFTDLNWAKFANGKTTTIRTQRKTNGIYHRVKGSYYKPIWTGQYCKLKFREKKLFSQLTGEDAKSDGFAGLEELKAELIRLHPDLRFSDRFVYIHDAEVEKLGTPNKIVPNMTDAEKAKSFLGD